MNITFTSSSTPTSFAHLQEKLTKEGGISGLMNRTIKQSLLKTMVFELSVVTEPKSTPYFEVSFFDYSKQDTETLRANSEAEVEAILVEVFKMKENREPVTS